MDRAENTDSDSKKAQANLYPFWSPRFWHGMQIDDYLRLLARNRFRVDLSRWPMAFAISLCATLNTGLGLAQHLVYGRRIAKTKIEKPPVFVIGHWRSGTTLTHELLSLDEQFSYPSTYDCFLPHHFLFSRPFLRPIVSAVMPKRRPMDNMAAGADLPQEDEFALCTMGAPTPYFRVAFPNEAPVHTDMFDLDLVEPQKIKKFRQALTYFLRALTLRDQKQLMLKSPPHTGRIGHFAQWFPGAKFLHIARNPLDIVPSTVRLWRTLDSVQGLQVPRYDDQTLYDVIFQGYDLMYGGYFRQSQQLIDSKQLFEIRYEDLVAEPVQTIATVYRELQLGDYSNVAPKVEQYFANRKDYRSNPNDVDDQLRDQINDRWQQYATRYGYSSEVESGTSNSLRNASSVA